MRVITQIIVHCSYTTPAMNIGAKWLRDIHVGENGWSDIGYHYVIRRDGKLEPGRDLDNDGDVDEEIGAHAAGFNANSIGICLVGGKRHGGASDCNFTAAQWAKLERLYLDLHAKYPKAEWIGHRDVNPGKTCPTFDVKAWVESLVTR